MVVVILSGSAEALIAPIQPIVAPISSQLKTWLLSHDYDAVPLYRVFYSAHNYYTTDLREYQQLLTEGDETYHQPYHKEIVAYIAKHQLPGLAPIYVRQYYDWAQQIHKYDRLINDQAEILYGDTIIGYAYPAGTPASTASAPLYEWEYFHRTGTGYWGQPIYRVEYRYSQDPSWSENGFEFIGALCTTWGAPTVLQEITLGDLPSTLTGRSQINIQWRTKRADGYIKLLYSVDDGDNWTPIDDRLLPNPGVRLNGFNSYPWTVPNLSTTEFRIKAVWYPGQKQDPLAWVSTPKMTVTRALLYPVFQVSNPIHVLADRPAAPTGLIAAVPAPSDLAPEIRLYWTDNAYNETGYLVRRWEKNDPVPTLWTCGLPVDTEEYRNTGITPGTEYVYEVIAKGNTNSNPSNQVTAVYVAEGGTVPYLQTLRKPDAPTGLTASLDGTTPIVVRLAWTPNPAQLPRQEVQRKVGTADWTFLAETDGAVRSYIDSAIPAGTTGEVSYRVFAATTLMTSDPSGVASVTIGSTPPPGPSVPGEPEPLLPPPTYDGSQSDWAQAEITLAHQLGLTYPGVMTEFQRKITREEFCTIAVRLYEKLSGKAAAAGEDPFADTDNPDILKAFALGIVRGVSPTQFAPGNNITRQEMCVMIYRALLAAGENTLLLPGGEFPFGDTGEIATWAMNEVRFCYQKQIMKGTSPTTISPLVNTPREQAIVLIYRTYQAFK